MSEYENIVLSNSPYGFWRMESPTGSLNSIANIGAENPNYVGFYAGIYEYPVGAADFENGCARFNGINSDFYTGPVQPTAGLGTSFTAEFWIKIDRSPDDKVLTEVLMSKGEPIPGSWNCDFFIGLTAENKLTATLATTTTEADTTVTDDTALEINKWYLIHVEFTQTSISFYVDGNLRKTGAVTNSDWGSMFDATKNLRVGNTEPSAISNYLPFKGDVDEVALYNTSLTSTQKLNRLVYADVKNVKRMSAIDELMSSKRVTLYDVDFGLPYMARTYEKLTQNRSPICYWKGEITSPINHGQSGTANNPTYNSMVFYGSGFADECDESLKFNGANYTTCGGLDVAYDLSQFSVEFWISPEELVSGSPEKVVLYKGDYGTIDNFIVTLISNNYIKMKVGGTTLTSDTMLPINQWSHIVITIDGSYWRIYVNGVLDKILTTATTITNSASTKLSLGVPVTNALSPTVDATYGYLVAALDEIALYQYPLSTFAVYEHYQAGTNQVPIDDSDDVNVAPVYTTTTSYSKDEFLNLLQPVHHWALDEAHPVPSNLFVDTGSGSRDLTYGAPAEDNIVASPTYGASGNARNFKGRSIREAYNTVGLNVSSPGNFTGFTFSTWYKSNGRSSRNDTWVYWGIPGNDGGFCVTHQITTIKIYVFRTASVYYTFEFPNILENEQWYHFAFSISATGKVKLYVNGTQVSNVFQTSDSKGLKIPPTNTRFEFGDFILSGFDEKPTFDIDEPMVFDYELTASQLNQLFNIEKYGDSYGRRSISSDPSSVVANAYIPCGQYAEFKNQLDITPYVLEYSIETSLDQAVDAARLIVTEDFYSSDIADRIQPNSIIKIEERYFSRGMSFDTGWVEVGTFFIDGPAGQDIDPVGKFNSVALSSTSKMLILDYFTRDLEPDIVQVEKTLLTLQPPVIDTYKFRKLRDGYSLSGDEPDNVKFLYNWANNPNPKIFLSNFTQLYSGSDERKKNLDISATDEIRLRGGEGAVQLLFGEGSLVIDKDYYESSIPEIGLGNPNTSSGVKAEFSRYVSYADIQRDVTVGTINFETSKYAVTFSGLGSETYDTWSFIVKSGDAKGNFYKLKLKDKFRRGEVKQLQTTANDATVGVEDWVNTSNSVDGDLSTKADYQHTLFNSTPYPPVNKNSVPYYFINQGKSKYLKVTNFDGVSEIPDSAQITGIELTITHSEKLFTYKSEVKSIPEFEVRPSSVKLVKTGTISSTELVTGKESVWAKIDVGTGQTTKQDKKVVTTFGNQNSTWGETLTGADIKDASTGFVIALESNLVSTTIPSLTSLRNFIPVTYIYELFVTDEFDRVGIYDVEAKIYYKTGSESYYVTDAKGRIVNPVSEGIEVGDEVQIGDCNRLEDAIRKVMLPIGFQESDPTKPFYLDIQESNVEIVIPPLDLALSDQVYPLEVLEQIMEYAPPNYNMIRLANGGVQFKSIVVPTDPISHELNANYSESIDKSDFNLYTRVVGQGLNLSAVNVALHADYGGQSAIKAYKKNNFADTSDDGIDYTSNQANANSKVKQVIDLSAKTPYVTYDGVEIYGTLYQQVGKNVNRWSMEETDLFCIDLGLNTSQSVPQEFEIDNIELSFVNTYSEGNIVNQTVYIYTMTEEDYNAEYNTTLPTTPSQTQADSPTGYFPDADAQGWKLLTNEITLEEGVNIIGKDQFLSGREEKFRFIKVKVGQPHFRFEVDGKYGGKKFSRINIPDIKIWTSNRILASAELGISNNFNGSEYKDLVRRFKRRTFVLELNPYLNTFEDTKTFAENELLERSYDFSPLTVSGFAPLVKAGDVILYTEKERNTPKRYLVRTSSQTRTENEVSSICTLQNFDIEFN